MSILESIVARRMERIAAEGSSLGKPVPVRRQVPHVRFGETPYVICEVKRRSPSKGNISVGLDPVEQARKYVCAGITSISVLTEEDHFGGSLDDLMRVKAAFPNVSVLRKDFLLTADDIDVSYRAGADAVLLIASVLDSEDISQLYAKAIELGMTPLVEVHDENDLAKVESFKPVLTGINSRNLKDFSVDLLHPVALRSKIAWETRLVFESGIDGEESARLAATSGFDALLVGEAVVRKPALIADIIRGATYRGEAGFWAELFSRKTAGRPLVKICGLTNGEDAELAAGLGADLLGFVFAASPRAADAEFVRSLGQRPAEGPGRVGVVVSPAPGTPGGAKLDALRLLKEGALDAIQFHGNEGPEECYRAAFPYYKALRPHAPEDTASIKRYGCPRVLIDAFVEGIAGGTGRQVSPSIIEAARCYGPLWLAGGLNPDNVRELVASFSPELIDASSGLECKPGKKDREKMHRFFEAVNGG
jgi:indole-3-glycerol phosphate synthase / phosphoribosylanthranilate isomerase